ncbi:(2Fe-2S)-binding protein [Aidingimonas lacisalsi]|uniref:(2Fe-2S)-binding protein n=1 Tax=Aidingimonas lacisalsi TaxID=2604086 RepID=UPI0011D23315|nr:(2Fe-2S)-binding protein [Aidingimonas lacisalsi]
MFQRIAESSVIDGVDIQLDGEIYHIPVTLSVAAAVLFIKGDEEYRRHVDGHARAPFCLMGCCHECLITIDGEPNRRGCLVSVAEGMSIERQLEGSQDDG